MGPNDNVSAVVPSLGVRDIAASVRFYVDGLGFTITRSWTPEGKLRWCWLELGGSAVMLQEFWREGPNANLPGGAVGEGVSLYFLCEDAVAVYRTLKSRGLAARRPFVGNAMWVVGIDDPDGYRLFFESPTDEAEETELGGEA